MRSGTERIAKRLSRRAFWVILLSPAWIPALGFLFLVVYEALLTIVFGGAAR